MRLVEKGDDNDPTHTAFQKCDISSGVQEIRRTTTSRCSATLLKPALQIQPSGSSASQCESPAGSQFENQCFIEKCSGSEVGSYSRLVDFVYHSTLGLRVKTKKKKKKKLLGRVHLSIKMVK